MCDEFTAADNDRLLGPISRRGFGAGAGAVGLMAVLPRAANAMPVKGRD